MRSIRSARKSPSITPLTVCRSPCMTARRGSIRSTGCRSARRRRPRPTAALRSSRKPSRFGPAHFWPSAFLAQRIFGLAHFWARRIFGWRLPPPVMDDGHMNFRERWRDYWSPREQVDTSPRVSDEVKYTTCYMCACRCGIKVHLKDGGIRFIEGNPRHPVNRGVICGKGASGIMQHYSPARLSKPLLRVGERGAGEFREIEWDEAIATAVDWLSKIRAEDTKKLAFCTGRDQSQSLTGFWATQFGTPNFAAHGGFCSVNMAAAGMYTLGGSFWEFGEPDWERTKLFLMFGVAEDHDSNPIKLALSGLRRRGAKFISINPVRTGYSAIADEWIGIRPGTDGLFVLSLIHELLRADTIDFAYLGRYTNAAWLVIQAPGAADDGLFARNDAGDPVVLDRAGGLANAREPGIEARVVGEAVLA